MKQLVLVAAVVSLAACARSEEAPMADSPAAAPAPAVMDSAAPMADSTMKADSARTDTTRM
ncbi:MAG: hypothetical protein HUU26_12545 [Gemmatimonadaceae bacterium]|nr:hypothetical protein [Gemmatimonadaceae bacterium]